MGYFLFLLTTATLFVRPHEIVPAVYGWQIYEYLILACLAVSIFPVLEQLSMQSLAENPITACVLGLWAAVVLSQVAHFYIGGAWACGFMFFKVVVYYLLLVALIDSERRLKNFLWWLLLFIGVVAALALLEWYHVIELPGMEAQQQRALDLESGTEYVVPRLRSTGIFNDANDLAMILVVGVVIALHFFGERSWGMFRPLFLPLVGVFCYAIFLTQSRGGLLALMAALLTLFHTRWDWKRTVVLAALVVPLMLVVFKGRITSFDEGMSGGTGIGRIHGWAIGLGAFRQEPVFGIGCGNYADQCGGNVAHNSFVHAYTELGFLGGTFFFGAFATALATLYRLRQVPSPSGRGVGGEGVLSPLAHFGRGVGGEGRRAGGEAISLPSPSGRGTHKWVHGGEGRWAGGEGFLLPSPFGRGVGGEGAGGEGEADGPSDSLKSMLPAMAAILVGYCVAIFLLSRCYIAPTYLVVGLVAVYTRAALPRNSASLPRFDAPFIRRLARASFLFVAAVYVFSRVAVAIHWA